jgi:hypothetical protein
MFPDILAENCVEVNLTFRGVFNYLQFFLAGNLLTKIRIFDF